LLDGDGWRHRNGKLPERGDAIASPADAIVNGDGMEEEPIQWLLDGVPLEVQEAWICEDLMFVMQVRDVLAVTAS